MFIVFPSLSDSSRKHSVCRIATQAGIAVKRSVAAKGSWARGSLMSDTLTVEL